MSELSRLVATTHGVVQGVGFRYFVRQQARFLGLTGYTRNLPSGDAVEIVAEGERYKLEQLLDKLKSGPSGSVVEDVRYSWHPFENSFSSFDIRR